MNSVIANEIHRARTEVKAFLPDVNSLSSEDCKRILKRYSAAIAGNFVNWMAATAVACRSVEGRYAAEENVYVEVRDDHSGMLKEFVKNSDARPTQEDYDYVEQFVSGVQIEVSKMSGLFLTTLMGVLENTSADFVPFLSEASKKLGNTNLRYTDVHGEADKEHADQFVWALEHEAKNYENAEQSIKEGVDTTVLFLKGIFA